MEAWPRTSSTPSPSWSTARRFSRERTRWHRAERPDGEGRRDRGGGHGGRAAPERDVPGGARERPPRARARERQDADELHPYPPGRPGEGRALALRPVAGTHHVPVQVTRTGTAMKVR